MRLRFTWLLGLVGIVVSAVLLEGCTLEQKQLFDRYSSITGIPVSQEQEVARFRFPFDYYAKVNAFDVFGTLSQLDPVPVSVHLAYKWLDENDNVKDIQSAEVQINPDGSIPLQSFPFSPIMFLAKDQLVVTARPEGGSISPGGQLMLFLEYRF